MRMRKKEQHNNCYKEKGSEYLQKSPKVSPIRISQINGHFEFTSRENEYFVGNSIFINSEEKKM